MRSSLVIFLASAMVGVIGAVACNQLAPPVNPSDWPCGSPKMAWCPGHHSCCYTDEVCRPGGYCADNEEIPVMSRRQTVADAGHQ